MGDPSITYFPVGNGDTVLIRLSDKTSIMIDCNVRQDSRDEDDQSCYDVHSHLLDVLERDSQARPFTDAFILSHADQDHSRGFETTFHTGPPGNYRKKDGEPEKIIIGELWFSRRIFSNYEEPLCEDAEAFRKEALRRIKLHKQKDSTRFQSGNRIRIIGYGESDETKGLNQVTTAPGNYIKEINGSGKKDFSFFVHAPFRRHVDSKWSTRNNTSIILQAVFDVNGTERAALALFGGDACWEIWAAVLRRSAKETIEWDLLLSPHHCSWSFFNEVPYEENREPRESSLRILAHHRDGAFVIASSKPIRDDDSNPPHHAAKEEYTKVVGNSNFFCTGETPSEERPEPLTFRMTQNGPQRDEPSTPSRVRSVSAVSSTLGSPRTYGHA